MTISLWQRTPTHETEQCDVAIIGAGITGLSAAIELESRGISCIVLEADYAGSKASGRNAGYLIRGAAENYALACKHLGRDTARFLWEWTQQNLIGLRQLGLESTPGFAQRPSCVVALGEPEHAELIESHRLMTEDGLHVSLISEQDAPDDALWRSGKPTIGLLNPEDAVCSPIDLVQLLAATLTATPVFEQAEVYRLEDEGNRIRIRTRPVDVVCSRVLVCTNAYASQLLRDLEGVITPNRGQMLAIRPDDPRDASLEFAYYLNHGSEYVRAAPGGQIIFGGARTYHAAHEQTSADDISDEVQEHLERFVRELITEHYRVTARWSGIMGFSPDGMPVITRSLVHTLENPNVWFCGGLTGHGMSMGYQTGRHAARVMLEDEPTRFGLDRFARAE
ncbi:MAG: FAD-binding oxidoreductase [Phycisphaerales bacterium]|nr:FAD-binding oxidoreductase [Phycisphaerales bacterium]